MKPKYTHGPPKPTFDLPLDNSGVSLLPHAITLNGVTKTPTFRYEGQNASSTTWTATAGDDLTASGSPAGATTHVPFVDGTQAAQFDGVDDRYVAPSNSYGQPGTDDFVVEAIFRLNSSAGLRYILASRATGPWWAFRTSSSGTTINPYFYDGVGAVDTVSGTLTDGAWYHVLWVVDRNHASGSQLYVNGSASGFAQDTTGATGDLTPTASPVEISHNYGPYNAPIAYVAMWQGANWLNGQTDAADVAKERFALLTGLYPKKAAGTALPTTMSRASTAYMSIKDESTNVRRLFLVGKDWLRIERWPTDGGEVFTGYHADSIITNYILQSEDVSTTWTKLDVTDTFSLDAVQAPDEVKKGDGLIASTTNGPHGITQTTGMGLSSAYRSLITCWAKKGNQNFLYIDSTGVTNGYGYFDLLNGTLGTIGSGILYGRIEDWGNGWYRCQLAYPGSVDQHVVEIRSAPSDGTNTFAGDGATVNTYLWGIQVEAGSSRERSEVASTYVPTTTATVSSSPDFLVYKADDGNLGDTTVGSMSFDVVFPNIDSVDYTIPMILMKSGDYYQNSVSWIGNPPDDGDFIVYTGSALQASLQVNSNYSDGNIYRYTIAFRTDDFRAYRDGVLQAADTLGTLPTINELRVGKRLDNDYVLKYLMRNVKLFKIQVSK